MFGKEDLKYKVIVGRATRGGALSQQAATVERAAQDLVDQLNAGSVQAVHGIFFHDSNPLQAEVIAVVGTLEPKKKEK